MTSDFARQFIFLVGIALLLPGLSEAQSHARSHVETTDGDVDIPVVTGDLNRRDGAALKEIADHFAASGATPWVGMQGTGKITYGSNSSTSYDATLSNFGTSRFRLDAQTDKGPMSIRIEGFMGKIRNGDGTTTTMPVEAAMAGLFPFELARVAHASHHAMSLSDGGRVAVRGSNDMHKISLERASLGMNPSSKTRNTLAMDLYFDPSSHLLIKSSIQVPVPGPRDLHLLSVITYGDYRRVGASLVPFRFSETLEGQPYWTLQLSDVQLNTALTSTYFEF